MTRLDEELVTAPTHLVRIPDSGVTEQLVVFADQAVLDHAKAGIRILDIGCGRGVFSEKMSAKGAKVTGIDIVPEEIEAAQIGTTTVDYQCMAAEDLEEIKAQFDLIVSRYTFHHLEFPKAAESIRSVLAPGGRLFVVDCYQSFWSLNGRLYVLWSALQALGIRNFLQIILKLCYFFTADRLEHVRSDIRRLREQKRYTLNEVDSFYSTYFPGCKVDTLGPAFTISWQKPLDSD